MITYTHVRKLNKPHLLASRGREKPLFLSVFGFNRKIKPRLDPQSKILFCGKFKSFQISHPSFKIFSFLRKTIVNVEKTHHTIKSNFYLKLFFLETDAKEILTVHLDLLKQKMHLKIQTGFEIYLSEYCFV